MNLNLEKNVWHCNYCQNGCPAIADKLIRQGCTVKGVPGFYLDGKGRWTIKFFGRTSGILIPIKGMGGQIQGLQTRLDHPIRDKDDPPEKSGIKYLSLSSSDKELGASSGSPVHFVGDPCARVVYVTEGALKADIAHALTGRTFLATIGANNTAGLDPLFATLAKNGTEEIIEAEDMDKYRNHAVNSGASKIYLLAKKHGMSCRRLTWNPRYNGIDDWLLAMRRQSRRKQEEPTMKFKEQYLHGYCEIEQINEFIGDWDAAGGKSLAAFLGLTDEEYTVYRQSGAKGAFESLLDRQRTFQRFRVYRLDLETGGTIPYAFLGYEKLSELGYEQPRAADYRLVCDAGLYRPVEQSTDDFLERVFAALNRKHPKGYRGRSLSISDVVELYHDTERKYYYLHALAYLYDHPHLPWNSHVRHDVGMAKGGFAIVRGIDPKAMGRNGDVLALARESPAGDAIEQIALSAVDGDVIREDTWYNINFQECAVYAPPKAVKAA